MVPFLAHLRRVDVEIPSWSAAARGVLISSSSLMIAFWYAHDGNKYIDNQINPYKENYSQELSRMNVFNTNLG